MFFQESVLARINSKKTPDQVGVLTSGVTLHLSYIFFYLFDLAAVQITA